MSRLTDLISRVKASDPETGKELEREFKTLSARLPFGLNFERHSPESVELPGRPIRKGDKVRILEPRGSNEKSDPRLYRVVKVKRADGKRFAEIEDCRSPHVSKSVTSNSPAASEVQSVNADDLIVVAEFRDYIYPGLVSTGKVTRGGDKPFHTVINAENFHALEALTFTHRGRIDAIYIDPPYNTGARDWKYNNDYVEGDDIYRHSKWLAMMERRLLVARELLNPDDSVLIVTIDEKEVHRIALLLEQVFAGANIQMIDAFVNPAAVARPGAFGRSDEYIYFVMIGSASPNRVRLGGDWVSAKGRTHTGKIRWDLLRRSGTNAARSDRPNLFYPIYIDPTVPKIADVGNPLPRTEHVAPERPGLVALLPIRRDGTQGNWTAKPATLMARVAEGRVRVGGSIQSGFSISVLKDGEYTKLRKGEYEAEGFREDGSLIIANRDTSLGVLAIPHTQWRVTSHDSTQYGSRLLSKILPQSRFPFPKSLYAVEDALRFFVADKPEAIILDFFAGSGTTAHAVMRLNKQDGGRRQCISVTNNEVAADEQKKLREQGLRPGDPDWEKWGICDHITKPRIAAAITGKTPDGEPINGDYKFTDEFPMADGFEENAEFFTLTYETPVAVGHNHAFQRIAPLLWLRAGSCGSRIDRLPENGWAVVENYGLLTDLDQAGPFEKAIEATETARIAYIVTDDERRFQAIALRLPHTIEPVRLYEAYLTNFRFAVGR